MVHNHPALHSCALSLFWKCYSHFFPHFCRIKDWLHSVSWHWVKAASKEGAEVGIGLLGEGCCNPDVVNSLPVGFPLPSCSYKDQNYPAG